MNIKQRLSKLALLLATAAFGLPACDEGEHDYYYCATNNTDKEVCLAYQVVGDATTYYDTLQPGQTDTLSRRGNVSGDDVWDVETSAEIYQISQIDASIRDSVFSGNLRLRHLWGAIQDKDGKGVYNLSIEKEAFVYKNVIYFYLVKNNTMNYFNTMITAPTALPGQAYNMVLAPGQQAYAFDAMQIKERRLYVDDLYKDATPTTRIMHLQFSNTAWASAVTGEMVYPRSFNPHRAMDWAFEPQVIAGDTCGIFTLNITPEMLE